MPEYEYAPKPKKTREKGLTCGAILLAALSYGFSVGPWLFPWVYQLVAFFALAIAILLISRYLLRGYVYRVLPRSHASGVDLVITELYSRRRTVVCRVGLEEICRVTPITAENRRRLIKETGRAALYKHVAELFPKNAYLLKVQNDQEEYFLEICADETLIALIEGAKSNICPIDDQC